MMEWAWAIFAAALVAGGMVRIAWGRRVDREKVFAALDAIATGEYVLWTFVSATGAGVRRERFAGEVDEEPFTHIVETVADRRTHIFRFDGQEIRAQSRAGDPMSRRLEKAYLKHLDVQLEYPAD